ncbi:hypothetical protein HPB50_002674 [Hyalomma asiaticum]|uniref:Uncharacterized protein n=1 Tax=Hyalomma asiaticum TaxID=266040 RepID=A0ACB7T818_HYAAI|nr:hypothetical protein HPB50_002674 [Hyalomma asiaticum]
MSTVAAAKLHKRRKSRSKSSFFCRTSSGPGIPASSNTQANLPELIVKNTGGSWERCEASEVVPGEEGVGLNRKPELKCLTDLDPVFVVNKVRGAMQESSIAVQGDRSAGRHTEMRVKEAKEVTRESGSPSRKMDLFEDLHLLSQVLQVLEGTAAILDRHVLLSMLHEDLQSFVDHQQDADDERQRVRTSVDQRRLPMHQVQRQRALRCAISYWWTSR